MVYSDINNGDTGLSARNKINTVGHLVDTSASRIGMLEDALSYFSAGVFGTPMDITDNGNGTATFTGVTALLYSTPDYTGTINKYPISGATFTFTDGTEEYVCVKYNSGSPIMYKETNLSNINYSNSFVAIVCWRVGTTVHSLNLDSAGTGLVNKIETSLLRTALYRLSRDGGLTINESLSPNPRTITATGAIVYAGPFPITVNSYTSATDEFTLAYHVSGSWVYTSASAVYENQNYDNGANVAAIPANKWATRWFYRSVGDVKQIFYVLGSTYFNKQTEAEAEQPRGDLPDVIKRHCILIGRSVIEYNATSGTTQSTLGVTFSGTTSLGTMSLQDADNVAITGGSIVAQYARFGTATSYTRFENDGTMVMSGSATVWDDMVFPLTTAKQGQTDKPPFDANEVAYLYPSGDTSHIMYIIAQFPHSMKVGSTISPHVHWKQNQSGSPVFKMDYKWFDLGGAVPAAFTTYSMASRAIPYTSGSVHQLNYNPTGISGSAITNVSSIMLIKLYRDDTAYTGNAITYQFDIHFERDSLGSRTEFSK